MHQPHYSITLVHIYISTAVLDSNADTTILMQEWNSDTTISLYQKQLVNKWSSSPDGYSEIIGDETVNKVDSESIWYWVSVKPTIQGKAS
jgi:RPA family protein